MSRATGNGSGTSGSAFGWRLLVEGGALLGGTLFVLSALWLQLPLANGPREWEWPYRAPGLHVGWIAPLLICLVLVLAPRLTGRTWWRLLVITFLGWVLSLSVLAAQPGGIERVIRSLVSRHVFSYVFDSGQFATVGETVRAYPEGVARLSMHTRTHPPGPLVGISMLDRLVPVADSGESRWLAVAGQALREEAQKVRVRRRPVPDHLPSPATVVLLALLLPAASALAAVPLYLLAKSEGLGDGVALSAAALWLAVPARTLFTPSIDQAVPLLVLSAVWLAGREQRLAPFAGGILWGVASLFSYGYLAAAPLVLWSAIGPRASRAILLSRSRLLRGLNMAGGFTLPWLGLVLLGFSPLTSFFAAMEEHGAMVTVDRAYGTWLLFNPWDFLLFLGLPVLVPAALDLLHLGWTRIVESVQHRGLAPVWWLLLLALWVSGTVRGEAGRIWLFLMPFACLFAARALSSRRPSLNSAALALECLTLLSLGANIVVVS